MQHLRMILTYSVSETSRSRNKKKQVETKNEWKQEARNRKQVETRNK